MRRLLIVPFLVAGFTPAHAGDPAAGENVFKRCLACHMVGEDAKPRVGPVLNGLIGRKSGTYAGFKYTEANKNSGLVWDEATLAKYLKNPRATIPGTSMTFVGIKKDEEIEDLIAYLKQFGPDGKPAS
ncbi:MAG: cytochrome c family protein [Xanthobacteraceae bacterium]